MSKDVDRTQLLHENLHHNVGYAIVRNWDETAESLGLLPEVVELLNKIGFNTQITTELLNIPFPENLPIENIGNESGEVIEDLAVQSLTINGRPLDREFVNVYPPVAKGVPVEMTKFVYGGEVIYVTEGEAKITFAQTVIAGSIPKERLITETVHKGDIIISTDIPNNWTEIIGDHLSFITFVGNPQGPQRYREIPKIKLKVV